MRQRGYTLVEAIFYVAILAVLAVLIVNLLLITSRSFLLFRINRGFNHSAAVAVERLALETRQASTIDLGLSVLDAHPGRLVLNSTTAAGAPLTLDFKVESGVLTLSENGAASQPLTAAISAVENLIFRRLNTTESEGVKMELRLRDTRGVIDRSENFYFTAVLRGSY
jgi:type II secretory pathway pseudopilin PulG